MNNPTPHWRPFEARDLQPFYVNSEGQGILNCYSKGDRRFSALYARLWNGQTIEQMYQSSKLDADKHLLPVVAGKEKDSRKGKDFSFLKIDGKCWPWAAKHEWYYLLWYIFLSDHEELLNIACEFDGYTDFYDGYAGIIYMQNDAVEENSSILEMRCCQARAIHWMVNGRPLHPMMQEVYDRWMANRS